MPCFKREKSLFFRSRRTSTRDQNPLAPKPVRPRAIKYHGLFGIAIARQHLIVDDKWTPMSLSDQYDSFAELLRHRLIYKHYEIKAHRRKLLRESKQLKEQCSDGRTKLQKVRIENNAHCIRNFLIKHRDMQRLYQKMPVHLVVDNINQRTFTLRKEKDRLEFVLAQRKHEYRELLLDRGEVENRIKYENEYVLEEELMSRILLKKIENSNVRLKAIKTINTTYRKMAQVLVQDEIFYEPILRSLDSDMEEQAQFIKHILYLGMPAISNFKLLEVEYRQLEVKSRKNLESKLKILATLTKHEPSQAANQANAKVKEETTKSSDPKHYVRETQSMTILRIQLNYVEKIIKELQFNSLCSQAKEIFPRIKHGVKNNETMRRVVGLDEMSRGMLEDKMNYTSVLEGVLINNLSSEEIDRLDRISALKKNLKHLERIEAQSVEYLRNRANVAVILRLSLWTILDLVGSVDNPPKLFQSRYPNSYLKLPLLKFEMLTMRAVPPDVFEEDTEKLMSTLKRKLHKLMKYYRPKTLSLKACKEKYHCDFLQKYAILLTENDEDPAVAVQEDLLHEQKANLSIPNRKQIKAQSSRLVDLVAKREFE